MEEKKFDLNIEKILEDWNIYHAIREIIANAIDEELLTKTDSVQIFKKDNKWYIRDYGRGLQIEHLTQKENDEKISHPHVIGKFGIGLKDALATFERNGVDVLINSKYGQITLERSSKHNFEDIVTLHAKVSPPIKSNFIGTEFILGNCPDDQISEAKALFLRYSGEKILESTAYGQVILRNTDNGKIYINGVRVAEEENFLFSYNITSLTKTIQKALNRERTNVGRSAYSDRVQKILLNSQNKKVASKLAEDMRKFDEGTNHDEIGWSDVCLHACKLLNESKNVVFVTHDETLHYHDAIDLVRGEGKKIVLIPSKIKEKLGKEVDYLGDPMRDLIQFTKEYDESFEYSFVDPQFLNPNEKKVFDKKEDILKLIGGVPKSVKKILISETMRLNIFSSSDVAGVWEPKNGSIIIKREQLVSIDKFSGTLIHEAVHASSGFSDVSREFEMKLTDIIGKLTSQILSK